MAEGLFARLKRGLLKTTETLGLGKLFRSAKLDEIFLEDLEEKLIQADIGPVYAMELVERLREAGKNGGVKEVDQAREWMKRELLECLKITPKARGLTQTSPAVWFFLGVNGVGKTTSLGKLASRLRSNRFEVMLAACDTFRAAAGEQLQIWGERAGAQIVRHKEGGDPSAVLFDACEAAAHRKMDYLLVDTAGRLHNKKNLMAECEKMFRTLKHKLSGDPEEVFLVVDATTGQNAVQQVKLFSEIAPLTGLILTKLDGTAKGGVGIQLVREAGIPIRYVGIGETAEDLIDFDAEAYVKAMLQEEA